MASSPQKNLQFISPPKEVGDFLQNQVKDGLSFEQIARYMKLSIEAVAEIAKQNKLI